MALFLQAVADGLQMGLLYALVAVGLAIIWGLMEMINFAHGEFMMLGMFGAWGLSVALGWDPLVAMVPIAVLMYGGGVLVYRLLMQRVQRGEVFTQIFATVGLFFFVQNGVVALFTSDYRFVSNTWLTACAASTSRSAASESACRCCVGGLIALALFLILYLLIDRTDFGLALQATSEDRDAAMLVGIRPQRMYAVAWGLGTAWWRSPASSSPTSSPYTRRPACHSPSWRTPSWPWAASAASWARSSPRSSSGWSRV